jgi:hypothetical protein
MEASMKITQEIATVLSDMEKRELTVLMGGVRITLTADEARALGSALTTGLKQLNGDASWSRPGAEAGAASPSAKLLPLTTDDDEKAVTDFRALVEGKPKGELSEPVGAGMRRPPLG